MATFTNLTDSARVLLNDVDKVRYSDVQLLEYANEAIAEAKRIRPDLFLGSFTVALPTYTGGQTVPVGSEYLQYLKDFVVSRAEFRDDEFTVDGRAATFLQKFRNGMLSA
jgi:hypothetical protein